MKRGPYPRVTRRNEPIVQRIRQIKAEHPYWGYRRMWAWLTYHDQMTIGINRVYRLMKANDMLVTPTARKQLRRTFTTTKPRPDRPNQWWGIDMTKVMIDCVGWVYVVIVIDWYTKKVVGRYVGTRCKTSHWLEALDQAVNRQFSDGVRGHTVRLMSDNGCQPTSRSFMKACQTMGIEQAFTSYNNPKGNADTERFMRTMKEECVWINEWNTASDFSHDLHLWIDHYNQSYPHSSLGYMAPEQYEKHYVHQTDTKMAC